MASYRRILDVWCSDPPMAGGLPSITSPAIHFADALWFTANLAGPALLSAAGLRLAAQGVRVFWYVVGYTHLLMVAGELRLWATGFHRLAVGWIVMAVAIGLLLLVLRRSWLWAVVGGLWSALLLAFWVYGGIVAYTSASTPQFPTLLAIQLVGLVAVVVLGILHLRLRNSAQPA